jgi:hypothetical protein
MSSLIRMVADAWVPNAAVPNTAKNAATIKVALLRMTPNSPAPSKYAALLFKQLTIRWESPKLTIRAQPKRPAVGQAGFTEGSWAF